MDVNYYGKIFDFISPTMEYERFAYHATISNNCCSYSMHNLKFIFSRQIIQRAK